MVDLSPDYIDPDITGQNRALLEAFYIGVYSEGGTADEVNLRGIRAVLAAAQPAPVPEPVAWCRSDKFANAMQRGGSFHGWKYPGTGPNRCDMPLYAQAHPTPPAAVPVSQGHPPDSDCDRYGNCWWFDPHGLGAWIYDTFQWTYSHWRPATAMPRPGFQDVAE